MQMYLNTSLYFCRWNVKTPSMADIQKFRLLPSNWPLDQSAAWKNNSFYLLTRMWIGHWTEGTGVFGTKQVRCLQCSGIRHKFNSYALLCPLLLSSVMLDLIQMKYLSGCLCIASNCQDAIPFWRTQVIYDLFVLVNVKIFFLCTLLIKSKLDFFFCHVGPFCCSQCYLYFNAFYIDILFYFCLTAKDSLFSFMFL